MTVQPCAYYVQQIQDADSQEALQALHAAWFGKQGTLTQELKRLGQCTPEERRTLGEAIHGLKQDVLKAFKAKEAVLKERAYQRSMMQEALDVTLPTAPAFTGYTHPITQVLEEAASIFQSMGFSWETGPEIEEEFYNFDALNVPEGHPARAEQDTFYLPGALLRTHTSPVQIRTMKKRGSPLKIIAPGRVYRSDYDQTHSPMFHQLEGLSVGENVNMAQLKGCLMTFFESFFRKNIKLRFRPSFFPFTEPSCEVDIGYTLQSGRIVLGGEERWLEILGCGMVHPNVLRNCELDPKTCCGYAFGLGLERIAMLKYGIQDLREFYENDQRWLSRVSKQVLFTQAAVSK